VNEVRLLETLHPEPDARILFDSLVGIDETKQTLLDELAALLDSERLAAWEKRHHKKGIALARRWRKSTPLILLSGEVGCGKTALASSVGTPLATAIDRRVAALETPSDLRGWGHVGEMSARITDAFDHARKRAREIGAGLLVIDEADDIATARAQNQAHHEDRAGLNVLIKQIDHLGRAKDPLAVILITNRHSVLDPAVRRRTALHLSFERPDAKARRKVFAVLLDGLRFSDACLEQLVTASERPIPFSYSDLVDRLARAVLREAQRRDVPVSKDLLLECLQRLEPSPLITPSPSERGA
jgi:SpoVK/Ycf46/Vps4 family AAA+-type ATPase